MKKKLLVVDDERRIADTLAAVLSQAGYEAWAAYDGAVAIEKATELTPDVLISDVVMPGMDGVTVAVNIQGFLPSCQVLLFSGQVVSEEIVKKAAALGHQFELLAKPVHPRELLVRLEQIFSDERSAGARQNA